MSRDALFELVLFGAAAAALLVGYGLPSLGGGPWVPGPRTSGVLRVATWNVGGASGTQGRALADEHIAAVADALARLEPDLVCLQELGEPGQLESLAQRLGARWIASDDRSRPVAVLARVGELREVALGGELGRRALAFEYERAGLPAVLGVTLHASAWSARSRNRGIGRAVEWLVEHGHGRALLLAGDLNLDLDLDKRRDLFSDDEYLDVETYNFAAQHLADAARDGGSTAEPDRRLDYVFFDAGALELDGAGPWHGWRVGDMDHDPVVADLRPRR